MNARKVLIVGAVIGFIVGVLFILVQPLFGMSPLTDRHAAAYIKLGDIDPVIAIGIAWGAHLLVSTLYGIVTGCAFLVSKNIAMYMVKIAILGWFTTVIAGPANALIVRVVTSQGLPSFFGLPALNFNLDVKLALHLIVFAAIALFLWGYTRIIKLSNG